MRFHEFSLPIPGGHEFHLRFHDRMTVIAGIGEPERNELMATLLAALSGGLPGATFACVDDEERAVTVSADSGPKAVLEDGTATALPHEALDTSLAELGSSLRVDADELGLRAGIEMLERHPELAEARASLSIVSDELQSALNIEQTVDAMRDRVAELDERIRRAEEGRARKEYARVLAELERVRAEAAVVRTTSQAERADELLLSHTTDVEAKAEVWREAVHALEQATAAFGAREQLPESALAEAAAFPAEVPGDLERLADEHDQAHQTHTELVDQLRDLAVANLPEPSDPVVADLARLDQDDLWGAHEALMRSDHRTRALRLGLDPETAPREMERLLAELDQVHLEVERATDDESDSKGPKLLSGRRLNQAIAREEELCAQLGITSLLEIQVRRMEQLVDPVARQAIEQAGLDRRLADIRWRELAGDVSVERAVSLEDEVRDYADQTEQLGEVSSEINRLRRRIDEQATPRLEAARVALLEACRPYGVDDTELAVAMVARQVEVGQTARLQRELERATEHEASSATALDNELTNVGFIDGDLASRLGAFEWASEQAAARQHARANARPVELVDTDLRRLEREASRLRRPEWSNVTAAEADEPDLEELVEERRTTKESLDTARQELPDLAVLRDRHRALLRRVDAIETKLRDQGILENNPLERMQESLMARIARARTIYPGSTVPVVIHDALRHLASETKYDLLDLCERLSAKVQIVYLTDDPEVAAWARRKSAAGAITLLEGASEDAGV